MPLKQRTLRRLVIAMGFVYLAVLAWVLSPLFETATPERGTPPEIEGVSAVSSIGPMQMDRVEAVPERPPGTAEQSTESVGEAATEPTAETESTEATESVAESPPPTAESGSGSGSGGGSGGETVIGFEG